MHVRLEAVQGPQAFMMDCCIELVQDYIENKK